MKAAKFIRVSLMVVGPMFACVVVAPAWSAEISISAAPDDVESDAIS